MESEIYQLIPHRPPFLWIDKIISLDNDLVIAEKFFPEDLDLCRGHYPGYPIIPGVILCESIFQAGAVLISKRLGLVENPNDNEVPVLTRIYGARFKRAIKPGNTVMIKASIKEKLAGAWMMTGRALLSEKVAVSVDFACAMAPK